MKQQHSNILIPALLFGAIGILHSVTTLGQTHVSRSTFGLLAADINGDGVVDTADLGIILNDFGVTGASPSDLNGDLVVDTADLGILLGQFGQAGNPFCTFEVIDLGSLDPNEQPGFELGVNATGLNEHGDVAGISPDGPRFPSPPGNRLRPFIYHYATGVMTQVGGEEDAVGGGKGVNDNGVVVGWWMRPMPGLSGLQSRSFIAGPGVPIFDPIASTDGEMGGGECWGINNSGQAITRLGNYFVDSDGTTIQLAFPDGTGIGSGWEINNAGVATGDSRGPSGFLNCYRYDSATDTITNLTQARWTHSGGYGINDRGDIAGWARGSGGSPAVIWTAEGEVIEFAGFILGPAHGLDFAEHVNIHGDVVGSVRSFAAEPPIGWVSFDAIRPEYVGLTDDPNRPTIHRLWDLITPEDQLLWSEFHPFEINDARQIAGIGVKIGQSDSGGARAFLATPIPVVPGDFNLDGAVTLADFEIFATNYGKVGGRPLEGDMNRDRIIDGADAVLLSETLHTKGIPMPMDARIAR